MKLTSKILCVALGSTVLAGPAIAQEYPERPIDMIVAYSAGGGTDVAARTLVPYIEEHLPGDATINVINRPGAGGEIGFTALANADPDGYTIGFVNLPNLLSIAIQRETDYELSSFQPVADIVYDPGGFGASADAGFDDLEGLVEYAENKSGPVTYGTTGIGSDDHLAALTFARQAGIEMRHIPFSGAADVRAALLGGQIDLASTNVSELIDYADSGDVVILGQMGEERWSEASDIPTFQEQGFDVVMGSDRGLAAPAGFPEDALATLQTAVEAAVADPEFQERAQEQRLPLSFMDAEAFGAKLDRMNENLQGIWEEQPWVEQ
ncbi:tripartite tricarboxylate transporter substrate binding protein [Tranquillimonas alkanivorans]|uniref:Tripartite-type tricarboxylate transporter, receptor component TctC n=1 Tax=Tranquillimonas alkanivorans TaxID=441119 RepID=A0A1I5UJZ9_9RHOB|nr:tripartite tricarboxylate transporter substrate binding protein [Tranquillimonas alkanivorans]SFP95509.1 Tripartite-type tricarboxylate transporter, receptor component TctC [Tranquillimonas alkanivorans]